MEASVSLTWDPGDRGRPPADPPKGDMKGVLADLEDALSKEGDYYETLLAARAITLALLGQREEADLVARRVVEDLEGTGDEDLLPLTLANGRLRVATVLSDRGEYGAAERAMSDVASFYEGDDDPALREVAARALASRVHALSGSGESDRIRPAWESLRTAYGGDLDPWVRRHVARGGAIAAVGLRRARRRAEALATCDEVIELYRSDTDPAIRGEVAVTMMTRLGSIVRPWRFPRLRAVEEVLHFIGTDPEPEVIEALRQANPKAAEKLLRLARDAP